MAATPEAHTQNKDRKRDQQTSNKPKGAQHSKEVKDLNTHTQTSQDQRRPLCQTTEDRLQVHNDDCDQTARETSPKPKSAKEISHQTSSENKTTRSRGNARTNLRKDSKRNQSKSDTAEIKDAGVDEEEGSKDEGEGEGKEGEGKDEEGDVNPLSVDLFDKLCAEKQEEEEEEILQWDGYLAREDVQRICRKLFCSEKHLHALLMSIFMAVTFAMVFGLCVLQAQMSMNSKELLAKVQGPKKPIPQGMYTLYYDYLESGVLPENVDMRANTSIFVH